MVPIFLLCSSDWSLSGRFFILDITVFSFSIFIYQLPFCVRLPICSYTFKISGFRYLLCSVKTLACHPEMVLHVVRVGVCGSLLIRQGPLAVSGGS